LEGRQRDCPEGVRAGNPFRRIPSARQLAHDDDKSKSHAKSSSKLLAHACDVWTEPTKSLTLPGSNRTVLVDSDELGAWNSIAGNTRCRSKGIKMGESRIAVTGGR